MAERQLTIRLTPVELEALKGLALKAGYASLDQFAKDQLIAQIEQASENSESKPETAQQLKIQLNRASSELKRIHQELRVFVVESIADFSTAPAGEVIESKTDMTTSASRDPQSEPVDELEELANQVFKSSPQLESLSRAATVRSDRAAGLATDETMASEEFSDEDWMESETEDRLEQKAEAGDVIQPGKLGQGKSPDPAPKKDPDISGGFPPRKRKI
jgi:hypothetical protein